MYVTIRLKLLLSIILLSIVCIPDKAVCQTEQTLQSEQTQYSVGVGLGINDFHIKDEYVSPYPFRGGLFSSFLNFQARSGNNRHEVDIYFSTGRTNPEKQTFKSIEKMGSLSYSFMHQFGKWDVAGSPLGLFFGAGISSFAINSDLTTYSKLGEGSFHDHAWYWSHSFNIYASSNYILSESQTISFTLNLPFFEMVSRPENGHWMSSNNYNVMYNSFFNAVKGSKGEFLWDNFVVHCGITYSQKLNDRIALQGTYGFNYTSSDRPLQMGMYMNNLLIGIGVIF